ncbi:MAG: hypothetical protein B7C24_12055 [Bacteroidetes bacterium 4572_77]|nr:MAG: hypothetical protein B7C24_12055 [Bacteroidetes bacterium 4572_77]
MIKYSIEKENIGKPWDDFVKNHAQASSFQTSIFFSFYKNTHQFQPFFCVARNGNQKIVGGFLFVIQRKGRLFPDNLFKRALIIGGPLVPVNGDRILSGLLNSYQQFVKRKVIYSEIRNLHSWSPQVDIFLRNGFKYEAHLNYQIPIKNRSVFTAFSESKRRQIKQSQKNGAHIVENPTLHQIQQFYVILSDLYRDRINKPLPDWSFFKQFQETIVAQNQGKYLLVQYQEKIIGGIMIPFFQQKMIYEWYVAGLDVPYKKQYPSVLATWAGIKYAIDHGFGKFDFMGAGVPSQSYGVREFKSKFGGVLLNHGRFINSHAPIMHYAVKLFLKLFAKK